MSRQKLSSVMSLDPITIQATSTVADAARVMRDRDVGDVIVLNNGTICGIVTDRDITIRAVAVDQDPRAMKVGDICSKDPVSLTPKDTADDAVLLMRQKAIRRLPIVEDGKPVGFVSLGDLAQNKEPDSALADISAAPPQT